MKPDLSPMVGAESEWILRSWVRKAAAEVVEHIRSHGLMQKRSVHVYALLCEIIARASALCIRLGDRQAI